MTDVWVKFVKQIRGANADASSDDVMLEKLVKLPFPPFIGLSVALVDEEWEERVSEVHVDLPLIRGVNEIICMTDPYRGIEMDISADDGRTVQPMKEAVKIFTDEGWRVTKE